MALWCWRQSYAQQLVVVCRCLCYLHVAGKSAGRGRWHWPVAAVADLQWIKAVWEAGASVRNHQPLKVLHDAGCWIHQMIVTKAHYLVNHLCALSSTATTLSHVPFHPLYHSMKQCPQYNCWSKKQFIEIFHVYNCSLWHHCVIIIRIMIPVTGALRACLWNE